MITQTKVLKFGKKSWKQPVVFHLAKDYDLTFSILKARVLPRQEGVMVLELSGSEQNYARGMEYLEQAGVTVSAIDKEIIYDDQICIQCGACTGFCPSDALHIKDRQTMEVAFRSDDCIGCELCLVACPSRALSLAKGLML
jgi:ferredoxin